MEQVVESTKELGAKVWVEKTPQKNLLIGCSDKNNTIKNYFLMLFHRDSIFF